MVESSVELLQSLKSDEPAQIFKATARDPEDLESSERSAKIANRWDDGLRYVEHF